VTQTSKLATTDIEKEFGAFNRGGIKRPSGISMLVSELGAPR